MPTKALATDPFLFHVGAGVESDAALLKMALHIAGAVAKLGQAAVDCPPFPATLEEEVEKLMNLLGTLVPSEKVGRLLPSQQYFSDV
jgi:hypothetical protein